MPKKVPLKETPAPQPAAPQASAAERVVVKEVVVERTVTKEVPKIVEVEKIVFPNVAFQFDSAELTDLGKGEVYLMAQRLKGSADSKVVIEGHADYVGSDEYNMKLGLKRAETVKQELTRLGVDSGRMSTASAGEFKPLLDQQTDWARAVNRRVEFKPSTSEQGSATR